MADPQPLPAAKRALEDLVSTTARRLTADAEPDYDGIEVLAKLTSGLAQFIEARTKAYMAAHRG